ncbi:TPA: hypothetical protein HA231_01815 [Candidatus Woesearchaeota archaeon]|nr:hypothetical protein [Candidatus Woesearchaeota archaeon]
MVLARLNSRYGEMKLAGTVKRPDVAEDVVTTLLSAYQVWRQVVGDSMSGVGRSYDLAVEVLRPHKGLLESMENPNMLKQVTNRISDNPEVDSLYLTDSAAAGFLAAALNLSGIELFAGVFSGWWSVGYRLPRGKKLVALPGSNILAFGEEAEGEVYNLGRVASLGEGAKGGFMINKGDATHIAGPGSRDCLLFNDGTTVELGIGCLTGNVLINSNSGNIKGQTGAFLHPMFYLPEGCTGINSGRTPEGFGSRNGQESFAVDFGRQYSSERRYKLLNVHLSYLTLEGRVAVRLDYPSYACEVLDGAEVPRLLSSLKAKVGKATNACRDDANTEEMVKRMTSYNWTGFKSSVLHLRAMIEEAVKE